MSEIVCFKSEILNELLSKQKYFLNELNNKKRTIGISTVQIWINELVNCVIQGVNEENSDNEITPTLNNISNDNQNNSSINSQTMINSQSTQEPVVTEEKSIEDRLKNLEVMVGKLIKPLNTKSYRNKSKVNNAFKHENENSNFRSNKIIKNCYCCGKRGHLSYQCYKNPQIFRNQMKINRNNANQRHYNYNQKQQSYEYNRNPTFLVNPIQQYPGPPNRRLIPVIPYPSQQMVNEFRQ